MAASAASRHSICLHTLCMCILDWGSPMGLYARREGYIISQTTLTHVYDIMPVNYGSGSNDEVYLFGKVFEIQ